MLTAEDVEQLRDTSDWMESAGGAAAANELRMWTDERLTDEPLAA